MAMWVGIVKDVSGGEGQGVFLDFPSHSILRHDGKGEVLSIPSVESPHPVAGNSWDIYIQGLSDF